MRDSQNKIRSFLREVLENAVREELKKRSMKGKDAKEIEELIFQDIAHIPLFEGKFVSEIKAKMALSADLHAVICKISEED
jgi:hypothetical protein